MLPGPVLQSCFHACCLQPVLLQGITLSQWQGCAFAVELLEVSLHLYLQPVSVPLNSSSAKFGVISTKFGVICRLAAHMLHPITQVSSKDIKA